jgi:deoxycytidylate deaminase
MSQHIIMLSSLTNGNYSGGKKKAVGMNYILKKGAHSSIHAEQNAIYKIKRHNNQSQFITKRDKLDIMVVRLSKNGTFGYSRPCRNCIMRLMRCNLQINNVYYTDIKGTIKMEKLSTMLDSSLTKLSSGDRKKKKRQ